MSNPSGSSVYAIDCKLRAALARADRALGCPTYLTLRELCEVYKGPRPSEVGFLASYARRTRKRDLAYQLGGVSVRYLPDRKMFHFKEEGKQ